MGLHIIHRSLFALAGALLFVSLAPIDGAAAGSRADAKHNQKVCPAPTAGVAQCHARVRTDEAARTAKPDRHHVARPDVVGDNGAYDPAYLQSAYQTPSSTNGTGRTVAIVDAYDDPNAEADLGQYRSFYGLSSCTSANGCFRKVDQNGGTTYPVSDSGWAEEISLDVDMASAICPQCGILLVEANSNRFDDLGAAVDRAAAMGANAISNSYGGAEYSSETSDEVHYNHPGIAVTASSGDNGYGVQFPAASQYVTAVGGTSLNQTTNTGTRNATETTWSGAGSGCSAVEPKPSWQSDTGCALRTVADVSAVADPNTGVWVYDSYSASGWYIFGGTSVASPIVAAVYALSASPNAGDMLSSYPYKTSGSLNDIVSGSTGTCSPNYLCTAGTGYDGPTGLGTPLGTTAFAPPPPPASLSFSPGAGRTLTAGQPSAAIAVQSSGSTSTAVTLTTSSATGGFATSPVPASWANTLQLTGTPSTFYYRDTAVGSPVLSASATGYAGATQTETVVAGSATHVAVSPTTASLAAGASQTFTATTTDDYGNSTSAASVAWTASGSGQGTLSAASGATTTFTAMAGGSVTITAALPSNGAAATATVSISVAPDFSLSVSPSTQTVSAGGTAYYTVTITPVGNFSSAVTLSVNCPRYASCSWSQNPATGTTVTLRIRTRSSTTRQTYPLTVTGTSGTLSHGANFSLAVA